MNVPNHIAIILDGNGRWAKAKGMPRSYGHVKGCANLETVCDYMKELGVKYVTVYAFSTENWKRPQDEVDAITADPPHILRPHRGTEIGAAVLLLQTDAGEVNLQPLEDPQIVSGHSNPLLYIKKASQSLCLQTQNM